MKNFFQNEIVKEILEWIMVFIIAVVMALLIKYFIGTPTIVQHVSMNPTLKQNERLILNRIPRTFNQTPKRYDIITFEAPTVDKVTGIKAVYENEPTNIFSKFGYYVLEFSKTSYIKRVIALPGEEVSIIDGKININGKLLDEPYLQPNVTTVPQNEYLTNFKVPEGYVFALGDNRSESLDCRSFGCIPIEKIESHAWLRFWPFDRFGVVK